MDEANDALRTFLVLARRHAFAGDGGDVPALLSGTRQVEFVGESWLYRDVYIGGERFAGQETILKDHSPFWTMVYAGGCWPEAELASADIYRFLRAALLAEVEHCRLPGRSIHGEELLRYLSRAAGDLSWFEGEEEIRLHGRVVYRLVFSGGLIR